MSRFGKLLDCMEFGQDHFIRLSGSQATDSLTMMVINARLGNQITVAGNVTLVKAGSS